MYFVAIDDVPPTVFILVHLCCFTAHIHNIRSFLNPYTVYYKLLPLIIIIKHVFWRRPKLKYSLSYCPSMSRPLDFSVKGPVPIYIHKKQKVLTGCSYIELKLQKHSKASFFFFLTSLLQNIPNFHFIRLIRLVDGAIAAI